MTGTSALQVLQQTCQLVYLLTNHPPSVLTHFHPHRQHPKSRQTQAGPQIQALLALLLHCILNYPYSSSPRSTLPPSPMQIMLPHSLSAEAETKRQWQ